MIRKRLQAEFELQELNRQLKQVSDEKNLQTKETEERKEKLQVIRDKLALFTETIEPESFTDASNYITQDDIELTFLFEKQRYAKAMFKGESS